MSRIRIAGAIARRELRGGLRGFRVFLVCLALGVGAIAAIGLVRAGIENGLAREGAVILGGDASIELTYRFATLSERTWLEDQSLVLSEIADFRSMLVLRNDQGVERTLTQVKAVDAAYPLYGEVRLLPEMRLDEALREQGGRPGIVADRLLADRFGLSPGAIVQLGTQEFVLSALIERAPDEASAGFGLGPRSIVHRDALIGSGLLSRGSLFETEYRMKLAPDTDLDALRDAAEIALPQAGFQWRDRRNGAPGISEFVERLSAFLVLVGLTGLIVGGVGIAAAVRSYLQEKTRVIATLRSLGADKWTIFLSYFLQIGVLSIVGIALGLVIGAMVPPLLGPAIAAALPVPAVLSFSAGPFVEAAIYGLLSALLFTLWPLARTENIQAAALFRDGVDLAASRPRAIWIAAIVSVLALLIATAAIFSGLAELTLWIAFGILATFAALIGTAQVMRVLARRLATSQALRGWPQLRFALGAVGGPGGDATAVVLSLGLGLTALACIGQIQANLNNAIARDLPEVAPSYFVVDIQNDQLGGLLGQLEDNDAISKVETAPMLRGTITKINDRPASDVAGDHWVLSGDRGITYSESPPENTQITAGAWWPKDYGGAPQISFAAEEAAEMGLVLGDTLGINVLGREITASITSFREVDFSTAGIGFILSMNPGALSGAPHTHIATIYAKPEEEAKILSDMADAYPNITAIRVRDAIERVSGILDGIAAAITYGAMATLVIGVVVLIGTAAAGEHKRIYEGAILKTLGASRRSILLNFSLRSAYLGLTAGLIAALAGFAAGWAVMRFVMDTRFEIEPASAVLIISGGLVMTLLTGLIFAWRPLSAKPSQVLRSRE